MRRLILLLIMGVYLTACNTQPQSASDMAEGKSGLTDQSSAHAASHDFASFQGLYIGDFPCADCKTIKVILTLAHNRKCSISERHIGAQEPFISEKSGSWEISADSTQLSLKLGEQNETKSYRIDQDRSLIPIDEQGIEIPCSADCRLRKSEVKRIENGIKKDTSAVQKKSSSRKTMTSQPTPQ